MTHWALGTVLSQDHSCPGWRTALEASTAWMDLHMHALLVPTKETFESSVYLTAGHVALVYIAPLDRPPPCPVVVPPCTVQVAERRPWWLV